MAMLHSFCSGGLKVFYRHNSAAIVTAQRLMCARRQYGRFNIGVIGTGRIGRMHMRNVLQSRKLALNWIVEDNKNVWPLVKEEFHLHDVPFFTSDNLSSILTDNRVTVRTEHETPYPITLGNTLLGASKSLTGLGYFGVADSKISGRCTRVFINVVAHTAVLSDSRPRRFDPTMAEAHRHVTNGRLGKIQYMRFTTRDSPKPSYDFLKSCDTTGCNILSDLCVHDVDQLVWLTQCQRPEHVYVTTHAHDPVMAEYGEADAIGMIVKYKNGTIASFDAFRESVYGYDIRMEIFGSDGMVLANNHRETVTCLDNVDGGHTNRIHLSFPQRFAISFQSELDHFIQCLEGRVVPLITKEECIMVAEIIDKGLESFRRQKPVYFDE